MNQQPTTTADFMRDYTIAMNIQMEDKENDGYPTMKVMVVPKVDDHKEAISNSRPLIDIYFGADEREGNDEKQRMVFYTPDGVYLTSNMKDTLPPDRELNLALNEAWAGDKDSKFMPAVQTAVQKTITAMMAAHAMSDQVGIPQQALLATLMGQVDGAQVHDSAAVTP